MTFDKDTKGQGLPTGKAICILLHPFDNSLLGKQAFAQRRRNKIIDIRWVQGVKFFRYQERGQCNYVNPAICRKTQTFHLHDKLMASTLGPRRDELLKLNESYKKAEQVYDSIHHQ